MIGYELQLEEFSGPFEKLAELIEQNKLDITQISLAKITSDFLEYITKVEKEQPSLLADFLKVASKLLLIKSKVILPDLILTEQEEQEIKDLQNRVAFFQQFRSAEKLFRKYWNPAGAMFEREYLSNFKASFYPQKDLSTEKLRQALVDLTKELTQLLKQNQLSQKLKLNKVNFQEKIKEILRLIKLKRSSLEFNQLVKKRSRAEIIVCFLVILQLIRKEIIKVTQTRPFSPITIMQC